jgi:hypothetical protein
MICTIGRTERRSVMNFLKGIHAKEHVATRLLEAQQHRLLASIRAREVQKRRVLLRRLFGWIARLASGEDHTRLASATNPLQDPK